jgi:1-deoxy-D-xylulose-5-phosphate reductoisomerase
VILTASGGPFRDWPMERMARVTPEQALKHPTWSMGAKISIDSATMMNKGLEVIEAARLFGLPPERIEVLVHPQSAVHGMVQYADGSLLAQLGTPDMRTPIAHALAWPARMAAAIPRLDLAALARLDFYAPDPLRFPALRLAREALMAGGGAPTILNAANETAVALFLDRRLGFLDIAAVVEETLAALPPSRPDGLEAIIALDQAARAEACRQAEARAATV